MFARKKLDLVVARGHEGGLDHLGRLNLVANLDLQLRPCSRQALHCQELAEVESQP